MQKLDAAWGKENQNCFAKDRISEKKCANALLDADDSFKDLKDQLEKLAVHTS